MCGEYYHQQERPQVSRRFTPTCVGSTSARRCLGLSSRLQVHPHMCGEYGSIVALANLRHSVHPHMCGEYVRPGRRPDESFRFTPTCVGSTTQSASITITLNGSPPHVWGVRHHDLVLHHQQRFTPTCVGSTPLYSVACGARPVHPHMCGEYSRRPTCAARLSRFTPTCVGSTCVQLLIRIEFLGSPPHVWGVLVQRLARLRAPRFTPTCVGSTPAIRRLCAR